MKDLLYSEPYRFAFFQAVRLLEHFARGRTPVGRFANPQTAVVRFGVESSLSFPASQVRREPCGRARRQLLLRRGR